MEITQLFNSIKQRLTGSSQEKKTPKVLTRRASFYLKRNDLSFIDLEIIKREINILHAESIADYEKNTSLTLPNLVNRYQLKDVPLFLVLKPDDYQLFLLESLVVPENEFREALNWRVRSLISFPAEDMLLDYFLLPGKKSSPDTPMIAALVARRSQLATIINLFKSNEMNLFAIDIPELAMRNLTKIYENDEKSTAFIYIFYDTIILNISRQKTLYFTRRINWGRHSKPTLQDFEQVGLDVLRYFDYFQSQWRFPSPTRIFIGSDYDNSSEIADMFSQLLLNQVQAYPMPVVKSNTNKDYPFQKNLLAFGGALREGDANVAPGN